MPTRKKDKSPDDQVTRRTFLSGLDAVQLFEMLERHYDDDGGPDGSAYRRLYRESLETFLEQDGPEAVNFKKLLESIDGAPCLVEDGMRKAGFILGFECCRQLLLGELKVDGTW
jgi:hypothetical protein